MLTVEDYKKTGKMAVLYFFTLTWTGHSNATVDRAMHCKIQGCGFESGTYLHLWGVFLYVVIRRPNVSYMWPVLRLNNLTQISYFDWLSLSLCLPLSLSPPPPLSLSLIKYIYVYGLVIHMTDCIFQIYWQLADSKLTVICFDDMYKSPGCWVTLISLLNGNTLI